METAMGSIEKHADYYRGFLADDRRSSASLAAILLTAIAMGLLFYLVSLVGPAPGPARGLTASKSPHGAGAAKTPVAEGTQQAVVR